MLQISKQCAVALINVCKINVEKMSFALAQIKRTYSFDIIDGFGFDSFLNAAHMREFANKSSKAKLNLQNAQIKSKRTIFNQYSDQNESKYIRQKCVDQVLSGDDKTKGSMVALIQIDQTNTHKLCKILIGILFILASALRIFI